ncbi:MAG: AMP-binding protein, partial [Acidimicrobiaceae bacterium]|nr:AMP-binding protein [Acidimicrobiaceae bacterium]
MNGSEMPIWSPSKERAQTTNLARFAAQQGFSTYGELHAWSVTQPAEFWAAVWSELGVIGEPGERIVEPAEPFWMTQFFRDASLNVAENLLGSLPDNEPAIVSFTEDPNYQREVSGEELRLLVGQLQVAMLQCGIGEGDCVTAWLPHIIETVAVMLAATGLGAVFSATSPDFGVDGVVDRFGQIKPKLLFVCDAYRYGGKVHERLPLLSDISTALPSLKQIVVIPHLG